MKTPESCSLVASRTSRILVCTLITSLLHAGDWLRFRGPNGSGVGEATGLPAEFGPGKNLVWKTLGEECWATPALADGRIYIRTRSSLYCFGR